MNFKQLKRGDVVYVEWLDSGVIAKTQVVSTSRTRTVFKQGLPTNVSQPAIETFRGGFDVDTGLSLDGFRSVCHLDTNEIRERYKRSPNIMTVFSDGPYCYI